MLRGPTRRFALATALIAVMFAAAGGIGLWRFEAASASYAKAL